MRCIFLCAAVLLISGLTKAEEPQLALQNIEVPAPDEETVQYLLPSLSSRYVPAAASAWSNVIDPRLYILTEMARQQDYDSNRAKRKMPSLSVINPFEVLRERLLLEISRKKAREGEALQAERNRIFLQNIGKRAENPYVRMN